MPTVLVVAVAGAAGALARWGVDGWFGGRRDGLVPWGIFVVNVSGAFLAGFFATWLEPRFEDAAWVRTGILVGFLGAYTTFSTLSLDTYRLLDEGQVGAAVVNSLGTLAAGLVAVWAGIRAAQLL